jgi:hypothetical protein
MKSETLQALRALNAQQITDLHKHHKGVRAALSSLIDFNFANKDIVGADVADCTGWAKENAKTKFLLRRLAMIQRAIKADIRGARTNTRPSKKHAKGAPHPLGDIFAVSGAPA